MLLRWHRFFRYCVRLQISAPPHIAGLRAPAGTSSVLSHSARCAHSGRVLESAAGGGFTLTVGSGELWTALLYFWFCSVLPIPPVFFCCVALGVSTHRPAPVSVCCSVRAIFPSPAPLTYQSMH